MAEEPDSLWAPRPRGTVEPMTTLPDDSLVLWERLRNLQFGAEQAQKAGEPEASQARL